VTCGEKNSSKETLVREGKKKKTYPVHQSNPGKMGPTLNTGRGREKKEKGRAEKRPGQKKGPLAEAKSTRKERRMNKRVEGTFGTRWYS